VFSSLHTPYGMRIDTEREEFVGNPVHTLDSPHSVLGWGEWVSSHPFQVLFGALRRQFRDAIFPCVFALQPEKGSFGVDQSMGLRRNSHQASISSLQDSSDVVISGN